MKKQLPDSHIDAMQISAEKLKEKKIILKYKALLKDRKSSEERYRTLFENSMDAITITTPSGEYIDVNKAALELLGFTKEEILNINTADTYVNLKDRSRFLKEMNTSGFVRDFAVQLKKKNGEIMDCLLSVSARYSPDGKILEYQSIIRNVTEFNRMMKKLQELSLIDELTGLYNRRGLYAMAEQHFKMARRLNTGLFCVFIDIDMMKYINDTFGHSSGDILLKKTADLLKGTFRESDIIARYGGDEFVILILDNLENPDNIIRRISESRDKYNANKSGDYSLSFSIGISRYNSDSSKSMEELISEADALMYKHKKKNKKKIKYNIINKQELYI